MVDLLDSRSLSIDKLVWCVIIAFVLSITALGQTPQLLLSSQTVQSSLDTNNSEMAEAFPVKAASSGQINTLSVFLDGSNTAATVWVGLYTNYYGHPNQLLSQAVIQQPVSGNWNSVTIPAAQVTLGKRYWIALLGVNGQIAFRDRSGDCNSETSQQTTLTSLPATWRTGSQWPTCVLSMFGSGGGTSTVSVAVSPTTTFLQAGRQKQFTSTVSGTTNTAVTWTSAGGTVTSAGLYTAPSAAGTYTITATSAADSSKSASAVVTVPQLTLLSISVSPGTASIQSGAQQQFIASVSGSSTTAVAWSASGGTITTNGLYVAPSAAGTYTVTATSAADSTKSASAVVTVAQPQQVAISVSPDAASIQSGAQQQFIASVSGSSNTAVAWSASGGTITISGLYVAPSAAGTYTVTATSAADSTKSASAVVTVALPQQVAVSVSPISASIQSGAQQQFIASVSGSSNTAVVWSASGGTITTSGLYRAPSAAGTYTVTATSASDSTKSASAIVTVPQQVAISVSPGTASIQSGAQQQFTASVSGSSNTAVTWSASAGTITTSGLYVAPSTAGTYTVTATSSADSTKSASALITVAQTVTISVSPGTASIQSGAQQQFTAFVSGTSNTAVTWSASGGTVNTSGMYVAPSTAGTYVVKAASVADPTKSSSASVSVSALQNVSISISPTTVAMPQKWQQQFAAAISGSSNTAVTWAVTQGTGTITQSGLYTAPQAVEIDVIAATSGADSTKQATASVSVVAPHTVSLRWSPSTSSNISSYNVYRGTANGGPYSLLKNSLSPTAYTDANVQSGSTYYYVTTAVSSSGMESC